MLKYKTGGQSRCANNTVNCGFEPRLKRWKARRLNHQDHCAAGTRTSGSRTVDVFWNCLRRLASTQVPHRTLHISTDLRLPYRCRDRPQLSGGRGSELLVDTAALYQLHLPARRHSFHQRYGQQACATCPNRQPVRYHNAVLNRGLTSDPVMTYQYRKKFATPNRSQTRHKLHTTAYPS